MHGAIDRVVRDMTPRDDVNIDVLGVCQSKNSPNDRSSTLQFLPTTALARPDDDLRDLVTARKVHQGLGRIVGFQLAPIGPEIRGQASEAYEVIVASTLHRVTTRNVNDLEIGLNPGRHSRGSPDDGIGAGRGGNPDHEALGGFPKDPSLMALKVFEEFLFGLVGEIAKGEFSQRNEIVCSEEVGERLWDFALGVDVAVQHPSPELFR